MKFLIAIILLITCRFDTFAQPGSKVFNDTVLHQLYIETELTNWFDTLEKDYKNNLLNNERYPEKYRPCKIWWDGIELTGCGFREKGNSSNSLITKGKKKPFKLSIDEFGPNQLDGLKKINLNNFTNDPSLLHDALSLKLIRDAELVAPRTTYTKLWVNGEYIGLYIAIENVDKSFLKLHYGSNNDNGNLYKTDRGAGVPLNWLGDSSEPYKKQKLKLTTNESTDDWTTLLKFINLINNDSTPEFKQKLEACFDVHAYLKILANEKCIRSFDSYWGGGNNFYLYEHPDGKIRWIPWDMNETFQDIKFLSGTTILDGYLVPANKFDLRPLLRRIFEIEDYKKEYLDYACQLIHSTFALEHIGKYAVIQHNLVDEAYRTDNYRHNTYEAFVHSLTADHIDYFSLKNTAYVMRLRYPGIFPFIGSQRSWVIDQLKGWNYVCAIEEPLNYTLNLFPNPAKDALNISNNTTDFDYAIFTLYDFTGKVIFKTNYELMEGNYFRLPLNNLAAGMYLVTKLSSNGNFGKAKVIVN